MLEINKPTSGFQRPIGKQIVELNGYVIILVEGKDGKIKLYGSPADRDNLEVSDEILDINERKLEDESRTEVIKHIHECIQSCMIKLRVKRRTDSKLAEELGAAVQDAFVIAVEQQSRERLERLSALKRITPVDMTKLSQQLNQQIEKTGKIEDLSFLKGANPIYMTSLATNQSNNDHLQEETEILTKNEKNEQDKVWYSTDISTNQNKTYDLMNMKYLKNEKLIDNHNNNTYIRNESSATAVDSFLQPVEFLGKSNNEDNYDSTSSCDLMVAFKRLQKTLEKLGYSFLQSKVLVAKNLINSTVIKAIITRNQILDQVRYYKQTKSPVHSSASDLCKVVYEYLQLINLPTVMELCEKLSSHDIEALLDVHDKVFLLIGGEIITNNSEEGQIMMNCSSNETDTKICLNNSNFYKNERNQIQVIQIHKGCEPLGATIRNERDTVVVGRVVKGGVAEKSGLLHEGDEILEVNGIKITGKSVNEVCELISSMTGELIFKIFPAFSQPHLSNREVPILHIRANFDYNPEDDLYIPCRELGISFRRGDILHVISRDDANWWQAYKDGNDNQSLAGLIPSQSFQHQREAIKQSIAEDLSKSTLKNIQYKNSNALLCKGWKKKKKLDYDSNDYTSGITFSADSEIDDILTYEEVVLYHPKTTQKRPIVLIGPPNIGRHELRQRLLRDTFRFAAAVPHTTRPKKDGEVSGVDYHYISRQQFEADIQARKFVEHGEYEKAYYGTSLSAIKEVISKGKICVLNLHPQSLKLLRRTDVKPFTVFVAPHSNRVNSSIKITSSEEMKDLEQRDTVSIAKDMEAKWGHLFDLTIVNTDMENAYKKLISAINALEHEPQWVSAVP